MLASDRVRQHEVFWLFAVMLGLTRVSVTWSLHSLALWTIPLSGHGLAVWTKPLPRHILAVSWSGCVDKTIAETPFHYVSPRREALFAQPGAEDKNCVIM